jgi:hypothetical protein
MGVITKRALLTYLGCKVSLSSAIDVLITEDWLSKLLLADGLTIKEYIST